MSHNKNKRKDEKGVEWQLYHAVFEETGAAETDPQITRWETNKHKTVKAYKGFVRGAGLQKSRSRNFYVRSKWFIRAKPESQDALASKEQHK